MKLLRLIFSAILLILLIGCDREQFGPTDPPPPPRPALDQIEKWLKELPGVVSVQELESSTYQKYYLIVFEQLVDPKNPATGTFNQRVFLAHNNFDSPVIFETEGYAANDCMESARSINELSKRYNANHIVVEHRYSGQSIPKPRDWKYLTYENAAWDLHAVRKALGTAYTGSWVATGASKGGTNAMSYFMHHPNDLVAAVAYVAPICNDKEDQRFVTHLQNVGTPEMRQKIADFQRALINRRAVLQPEFFPTPPQPTDAAELMTNDQLYEACIVDFGAAIWQKGIDIERIPGPDAKDESLSLYADMNNVFSLDLISSSSSINRESSKSDNGLNSDLTHYFVQTLIEMGSPAYFVKPIEDLIPGHSSWSKNTLARFGVPADASTIQFSDKLNRQMNQWLEQSDPRLICIYGEYDPWTAAAPSKSYFSGKTNMAIYVKAKGTHYSNIRSLAPEDEKQAWAKLDSWIKK